MTDYVQFLASKTRRVADHGQACHPDQVNPLLHLWQREIVAWAVRKGRAAIWADTGLGKTFMGLEWARILGGTGLIVAPLAVCHQTVREAARLGIEARYLRAPDDRGGLMVTNYEMVPHFPSDQLNTVILDEASILKQHDGKTRTSLIRHFTGVPNRLATTATPAPNEPEELTSQAEYLGIMPRNEMLAAYFINDEKRWRLKHHARTPMFAWMASWAVALRRPSDLDHPDDGYILPQISIIPDLVDVETPIPDGQLFATDLGGVGGRAQIRAHTLEARVERAAQLVAEEPDEAWVLWCGLNAEADKLAAAIPNSVNVAGNWAPEDKAKAFLAFADGEIKHLITKPSIAAFGLNWQHCARIAFVGLGDSYEQYYQAIRRCWRYGQTRPVRAHVITSYLERRIAQNVERKEAQAATMVAELVASIATTWRDNER